MKFEPKVSIIIPVYNGTNYLEFAVRSALAQTYQNFEILIVNDGSSDEGKTAALALRLQSEHPTRIQYLEKKNGGVASALNLGIEKMTGDYFSWLSHDDVYRKDKLQKQIEILAELPADLQNSAILYSDFDSINMAGQKFGSLRFRDTHSKENLERNLYPLVNGLIHGCSLLIPVHLLRSAGGFDETLRYTQDYDLWLKIFPKAKPFHTPEALISSRQHAEQDSVKASAKARRDFEETLLWAKLISQVTPQMRIETEGSSDNFFRKLIHLLYFERFPGVHSFALTEWMNSKNNEAVNSGTRISVLVLRTGNDQNLELTLESLRSQLHKNFEVIVADEQTIPLPLLSRFVANGMTIVTIPGSKSFAETLKAALAISTGSVISFLSAGDAFNPAYLSTVLGEVAPNGHSIVFSSYVRAAEDTSSHYFVSTKGLQVSDYEYLSRKKYFEAISCISIAKESLQLALKAKVGDPALILGRLCRASTVHVIDLPLVKVGAEPKESFPSYRWRDLDYREFRFLLRLFLKRLKTKILAAVYKAAKAVVFEPMPLVVQTRIRRLLMQ